MKYGIDFQYLAKGGAKPSDNTHPMDITIDDSHFALIPAVGDHIDVPGDKGDFRNIPLKGRVRSRAFRYVLGFCYVTIVVEDTDEDWVKLGHN